MKLRLAFLYVMMMVSWMNDLLDLLFPRCCVMCGKRLAKAEEYICVSCSRELPRTYYCKEPDNPLAKSFWGRATVERAAAYFYYYKDNAACRILYTLKYYNCPEIGVYMGKQMAGEMNRSGFFQQIDVLIPVPLASKKRKKRGYNQCEKLAEGISYVTSIPVDTTSLIRRVANPTQTRKRRMERWENVQGIFSVVSPEKLVGKHVLLIDDVVTTGATLISCMDALSVIPQLQVSVLTLAVARE